MISYTGDVSKPYPIVIFDHFGNPDTTYFDTINLFFIHKFQVKEKELLDLKQTIQQRETIFNNDTLRDALAIRTLIDEQDNIIFIKGREEISRLFKRIIDQWRESDKADLKSRLDQLSRRIGVAIITD
jgi:hypothetical protein